MVKQQLLKLLLTKDKNFIGVVLYSGENIVPFGENLFAVPINNLWD